MSIMSAAAQTFAILMGFNSFRVLSRTLSAFEQRRMMTGPHLVENCALSPFISLTASFSPFLPPSLDQCSLRGTAAELGRSRSWKQPHSRQSKQEV